MLLFNEIPQPLIFYDRLERQDRFKENHEKHLFELLVQHDRLLPFQLRFMKDEVLTDLKVVDLAGNLIADLNIVDFEKVLVSEYNYYLWTADFGFSKKDGATLQLECGNYYLKATTSFDQYYSETFSPISNLDKYLILEWSDANNVDPVYYGSGFHFRMIADTFITKGTPQITIEAEEDGHGQPVDISRKVTVTYDINLGMVPDYINEAISFMAIHASVTAAAGRTLREGDLKNISIAVEQVDLSPYWDLTINFEQGRYYFNTACGSDIKPPVIEEFIIDQGGSQYVFDEFIDTSI